MTDMSPRPTVDALCEYAQDVAASATSHTMDFADRYRFEREARERLYKRLDATAPRLSEGPKDVKTGHPEISGHGAISPMAFTKERAERLEAVANGMQAIINTREQAIQELVSHSRQLRSQLDELYNVLDEVRAFGCEPVVMLKELVRSYKAKGGELAEVQRKADVATENAAASQRSEWWLRRENALLRGQLMAIAEGLERGPGDSADPGLAFYVAQLRELSK